jgi:hypothetical protein
MFVAQCDTCHAMWVSDPGDDDPRSLRCGNQTVGAYRVCGAGGGRLWPLSDALQGPIVAAYLVGGWDAVRAIVRADASDVVVGLAGNTIDLPYPWRVAAEARKE